MPQKSQTQLRKFHRWQQQNQLPCQSPLPHSKNAHSQTSVQQHHLHQRGQIHDHGHFQFLPHDPYLSLKLSNIPMEIITEYHLPLLAEPDGTIYVLVQLGMYRLPQTGLLANVLLEKWLNTHGYHQSKLVPGLWTHDWRPIQFTLVVDSFCIKY